MPFRTLHGNKTLFFQSSQTFCVNCIPTTDHSGNNPTQKSQEKTLPSNSPQGLPCARCGSVKLCWKLEWAGAQTPSPSPLVHVWPCWGQSYDDWPWSCVSTGQGVSRGEHWQRWVQRGPVHRKLPKWVKLTLELALLSPALYPIPHV